MERGKEIGRGIKEEGNIEKSRREGYRDKMGKKDERMKRGGAQRKKKWGKVGEETGSDK